MYQCDPFGLAWIALEDEGFVDSLGGSQYLRFRAVWDRKPVGVTIDPRGWIIHYVWMEELARRIGPCPGVIQ